MPDFKVSIVLPIHNVGPYLERCLDSIRRQTLSDIEIVCVDDGSTDNSAKILRDYQRIDSRIRVLSQRNKGPASARNAGIKIARGSYVGFVDGDDWIDGTYFERLYDVAGASGADIVRTAYLNHYADRIEEDEFNRVIYSAKQEGRDLGPNEHSVVVWNAIYLREFLTGPVPKLFDEDDSIKGTEDIPFTASVTLRSRKTSVSTGAFYHYTREREGQVSSLSIARVFRSYAATDKAIDIMNSIEDLDCDIYLEAFKRCVWRYDRLFEGLSATTMLTAECQTELAKRFVSAFSRCKDKKGLERTYPTPFLPFLTNGDVDGYVEHKSRKGSEIQSPSFNLELLEVPAAVAARQRFGLRVRLVNLCPSALSSDLANPVHLSYHWFDEHNHCEVWDGLRTRLPFEVAPDNCAEFRIDVAPPDSPGSYRLDVTLVQEGKFWFNERDARLVASQAVRVLA